MTSFVIALVTAVMTVLALIVIGLTLRPEPAKLPPTGTQCPAPCGPLTIPDDDLRDEQPTEPLDDVVARVRELEDARMVTPDSSRGGIVVWKFVLRPWSMFMDVPRDAEVLSAGAQGEDVVVWALCPDEAPKVRRILAAHPTGVPLPEALIEAEFVATVQRHDGLVFHVFDGGEQKDVGR